MYGWRAKLEGRGGDGRDGGRGVEGGRGVNGKVLEGRGRDLFINCATLPTKKSFHFSFLVQEQARI